MTATVEKPNTPANISSGVMTFEQIRDIVGNGWAIIKNPVRDGSVLLGGELLFHSVDKDEVYQKTRVVGEKHVLFKYCGERDPNIVYLL
jgi:hypothetical protein